MDGLIIATIVSSKHVHTTSKVGFFLFLFFFFLFL